MLDFLRRYLDASASGVGVADFYDRDVVFIEHPNRFSPNGSKRDLTQILEAAAKGQTILASQRSEIENAVVDGDTIAVQLYWTGVTKIALGALPAGSTITAHFAQFYVLRDGRIVRQTTYDCVAPF